MQLEEMETARQATIQADKEVDELIDRLPKSHRDRILKKAVSFVSPNDTHLVLLTLFIYARSKRMLVRLKGLPVHV